VANIKKKKPNKDLNKISSGKTQQNGTIASHNTIDEKKSSPEKIEVKTVIEKKPKPAKKTRKNARLNDDDSFDTQELEEKDSLLGEWVEFTSKKERKSRKNKEEQIK